jgi:hypothetical protein
MQESACLPSAKNDKPVDNLDDFLNGMHPTTHGYLATKGITFITPKKYKTQKFTDIQQPLRQSTNIHINRVTHTIQTRQSQETHVNKRCTERLRSSTITMDNSP